MYRMPRNNTRRKQRGGNHTANTPFIISPSDYQGVMAPYSFSMQKRIDGLYYCDFMSATGAGDDRTYKFYRVFTTGRGDPTSSIIKAIKARKAADSA